MSRPLSRRLASGVGAPDQRWIEEWRSAFWEIVRKASTVDKAARTGVTFNERDERQRGAITDRTDWTFRPEAVSLSNPRAGEISQIARFAWTALHWNVAVVLWGAYVKATDSGGGCGNRWPLCDGDVVGANR